MNELIISDKSDIVAIADALRNRTGLSDSLLFPDDFISSISLINEHTIQVSVDTGATVTATQGDISVTGISENGVCNLTVNETGIWTINAVLGNKIGTNTIEISNTFNTSVLLFNETVETSFRYIKLVMDAIVGGNLVQFSEIYFWDENGTPFVYPAETTATSSIATKSNESALNLIDGNMNTKFCSNQYVAGSYVLIDLGANNAVDVIKHNSWGWATADDTSSNQTRNLKTFSLFGSNDKTDWVLLDSAINYNAISENMKVAYTGYIVINDTEISNEEFITMLEEVL